MNCVNYINDVFLYVLSINKNTIVKHFDFKNIDSRYLKHNNNFVTIFKIMRYNFSKFWNIIGMKNKYKLIELVFMDTNIDLDINSNVNLNVDLNLNLNKHLLMLIWLI